MGIKKTLDIAPYFDDYDISKKYYRILFKPGFAVQARELTQLQTTLQNQIEQFGSNIYKEGSIIKGCTFTELRNLKYIKVVDGIRPEDYIERTETPEAGVTDEYYYEIEDDFGLKAIIVQGQSGFQSRAPDLNTFFILYLNTATVGSIEKKLYEPSDSLNIREYILRTQTVEDETTETIIDNGIVATTSVAAFSDPVGDSFGLNATEGIIYQLGHFLFVDDQTIIVKKYLAEDEEEFFIQPNNISIGYVVDEQIVNSQTDESLLDNSNGSPNENAPGADRLLLVPKLVARDTEEAENDATFFILRRYENGIAVETRDVSQFNSIERELARRTFETNGDYTRRPFQFNIEKRGDDIFLEMGEGVAYSKGYRISNEGKRFFRIPPIETVSSIKNQPINFTYGGFVQILDSAGKFTISSMQTISLLDAASTIIGTAIVKNVVSDKVYLFAIRMNSNKSFSDVRFLREGTTNGIVEITPKVLNSIDSKLVFGIPRTFVNDVDNVSFSYRRRATAPADGSGEIVIAPPVGSSFDVDSLKDIVVVSNVSNLPANTISAEIVSGNLVIETDLISENAVVYHNARLNELESKLKLVSEVYVKTTASDTINKYTLGLPDVIRVKSIVDASNNEFVDSYTLKTNQKDDFYDHSYIEKIPGTPSPADGSVLTILLDVFRIETSSSPNVFDSRSYINVDIKDIPSYMTSSGESFSLKSCLDFRPYRIPTAAYSSTAAGATLLTAGPTVFPASNIQLFASNPDYIIPAVNTSGSLDVDYYVNRTDYIVGSSYGRFKYITGNEGTNRSSVNLDENTIIAEVRIPGFPLLDPIEASKLNRRGETPRVISRTVNRYTMKDIDDISKKIDRLTYYATLSALETSTRNLLIRDQNGLNRFKNGICVDPFKDLTIADVTNANFNASINTSETTLNPALTIFPIKMKFSASTAADVYGENNNIGSLESNRQIIFSRQKYATNFRSCTSNVYNYVGEAFLHPNYDVAYDTTTTPIEFNIDLQKYFSDYTDKLSEIVPLTTESQTITSSTTTSGTTTNRLSLQWLGIQNTGGWTVDASAGEMSREITEVMDVLIRSLDIGSQEENMFVGDFIRNLQFEPYMRSNIVQVEIYGLRPNTQHYFFFEGVDINEHVAPGIKNNGLLSGIGGEVPIIIRNGNFGDSVITNSNGEIFALFRIPENTFFVGERTLNVIDISSFDNIAFASASRATVKYNAYNFSQDNINLTLSLRAPEIKIEESTTTRTVVRREVQPLPPPPPEPDGPDFGGKNQPDASDFGFDPGNNCPIAQTFFVKSSMAQGAEALYLSRIDLFFKRKSQTNGVTVMIREVENGYPAWEILPFAKKHLSHTEVNVSSDSSIATAIVFDAPIRLEAEKEYAIVIKPDFDDPDYLIFTTRPGAVDLITGESVNSDWGDGVLFTSTNNRAWTAYQDEDLKFTLYRYNFAVNSGNVTLESNDLEFFKTINTLGSFRNNELVYSFIGSSTFQITLNTNSLVGTGSNLSNYSVGDYVYVENNLGVKDILRVSSIQQLGTQIVFDRYPLFAGTFNSRPVVAGNLNYFNRRKPFFMVLERSSARSTKTFNDAQNSIIYGLLSGAQSEIDEVQNIELSYIQSMISRVVDSDHNVIPSIIAIDPVNTSNPPYEKEFNFATNYAFNEQGGVIFSKSNDLDSLKNLKIKINLLKENFQTTTPLIDIETASVFAYVYNITDDPETTSKYISKRIELREGFDSEDFRLYLTGYRPINTDIKAYIKIRNEADPVLLADNEWIEMEKIEGASIFSSSSNLDDFREFVFEIPESNKIDGVVAYSNETGDYVGYRSFALRIDLLSNNVANVPKVLDYRGIAFE